ncbi:MAG: ABC transporter ATP-binding protein [Lachnospiraceae bacterium]|nr:ABC transporter ATP-binding protein [Lachnospiraceae bacterium]
MIEIQNLTKIYKLNKKQMAEQKTKNALKVAVDDLSLSLKPGEIYGLLGPNGAGKTTTLRCIATLLKPTEGHITVGGYDTIKDSAKVRRQIGFLTNDIKLDPQFSPAYLIRFFGQLHGLDDETIRRRQEELFTYFGIHDFENKKVDELSTGMKQKAAIAVSLVHDPDIIIFDEPTSGLDIITARGVTDYLKEMKNAGKIVLISTHIMSEAEKLCDRIGIIINGRKVCEGTLAQILAETHAQDLEDAFFHLYTTHGHLEEEGGAFR